MSDSTGRGSTFAKTESEYELIRAVGTGDILAFERLIERYRDPVLNFIFRYTGDRFAAEDIAQGSFLKCLFGGFRFRTQGEGIDMDFQNRLQSFDERARCAGVRFLTGRGVADLGAISRGQAMRV